jgi:uncharacterized membrane protein
MIEHLMMMIMMIMMIMIMMIMMIMMIIMIIDDDDETDSLTYIARRKMARQSLDVKSVKPMVR